MKRRDFLKRSLQLSTLPLLQGQMPLQFGIENFQVYWLHIEGAPIREAFDFWADPLNQFKVTTLNSGQRLFQHKRGKLLLPNIWHDFPRSKKLLDHWLSVRGISLKGPHLKQARREWFRQSGDSEKSIIQSFNQSFHSQQLPSVDLIAASKQTAEIYQPLLKTPIKSSTHSGSSSMEGIFSHWYKLANEASAKTKRPLCLGLIRSPSSDDNPLFESFDRWDDRTRKNHEDFYSQLLSSLEQFTEQLKRLQKFDKSAIIITSDRRKAPINQDTDPELEPVWQGGHFSLISGALQGPVTLGDIYREHPKYAQSYPMTWGVAEKEYNPTHVHQLIMDLCLAESRFQNYNSREENPWVAARTFQGLFIKGQPGRVI